MVGLAECCAGLASRCILCGACGPSIAPPPTHVIQKGTKGQTQHATQISILFLS